MTDPLDAQERAVCLTCGELPQHISGGHPEDIEHRKNGCRLRSLTWLQVLDANVVIRQAEIEATKITPKMIEAGAEALKRLPATWRWQEHGPEAMVEAVLKAALGAK